MEQTCFATFMPEYQVDQTEFPGDTLSMLSVPSSPIQSESLSVLDNMHAVQHERNNRLYKYNSGHSSSPARTPVNSSPTKPLDSHVGVVNLRNKHSKMQQVRAKNRMDTIAMQREKFSDSQTKHDYELSNLEQWDKTYLGLDIDQLVEEEREELQLECELEERALIEELEMAEMLSALDMNAP